MSDKNDTQDTAPPVEQKLEANQDVTDMLETVKKFDVESWTCLSDFDWIDHVRVSCRDLEKRKQIRTEPVVSQRIAETLQCFSGDLTQQSKSLEAEEVLKVLINCFSAFANLVVEDDPSTFGTCFSVLESGLFDHIVSRIEESLSNDKLKQDATDEGRKLETKLQLVGTIALTNFTLQFAQNKQHVEAVEDKLLGYLVPESRKDGASSTQKVSPISLVLKLAMQGTNWAIRKSAFNLLGKLSEFRKINEQVLENDLLLSFLEYLKDISVSIGAGSTETDLSPSLKKEEASDVLEIGVKSCASMFSLCSVSRLKLLEASGLLKSLVTSLSKESNGQYSKNVSAAVIGLFMSVMRGRLLMPGEEDSNEDLERIHSKVSLIKDLGLLDVVIENLRTYRDELYEQNIFDTAQVTTPEEFIYLSLELVNLFLQPITRQQETLEYLLGETVRFHQLLYDFSVYPTILIDKLLKETLERKRMNASADVDRDLVLAYAKIRKVSLFIINLLATSFDRCKRLITEAYEVRLPHDTDKVARQRYLSLNGVVVLLVFMVNTMHNFDVEGTEIAVSLLKNLFIAVETRNICIDQILEHDQAIDKKADCQLTDFGKTLCSVLKHPSHKLSIISSGICRLFGMMEAADVICTFFPLESLQKLVDLDITAINPVVRAECARFLSYLVRIFAQRVEEEASAGYVALILSEKVLRLVSFLLQSKYAILLDEGITALLACPQDLQVKIMSETSVFFEEESEDLMLIKTMNSEEGKGLEDLIKGIDNLEVDINEEDVDLKSLDEEKLKQAILEKMSQKPPEAQQQSTELQKSSQQPPETKEEDPEAPKLEEVLLKDRILQLSKNLFHYENMEEQQQERIVKNATLLANNLAK